MCYNCGPSRRSFATLLAAGVGMPPWRPAPRITGSPLPRRLRPPQVQRRRRPRRPRRRPPPQRQRSAAVGRTAVEGSVRGPVPTVFPQRPREPMGHRQQAPAADPIAVCPCRLVQPRVQLAVSGEASLLNSTTAAAAEKLFAAATSAGVTLTLASGYVLSDPDRHVQRRRRPADRPRRTRPRHVPLRQHSDGLGVRYRDGGGACSFEPCSPINLPRRGQGRPRTKFGFVVRYPWMLNDVTGYYYEPWHLRFIGIELLTAV